MPATSTAHSFLSFFAAAVYGTNEANKAGGMHRQAVYILRCLCAQQSEGSGTWDKSAASFCLFSYFQVALIL